MGNCMGDSSANFKKKYQIKLDKFDEIPKET
jgi:hypothetical protein